MAGQTDFARLRERAGTIESSELMEVAESLAWKASVARRRDTLYTKPGGRTLLIPRLLARGEARSIIAVLEGDAERGTA